MDDAGGGVCDCCRQGPRLGHGFTPPIPALGAFLAHPERRAGSPGEPWTATCMVPCAQHPPAPISQTRRLSLSRLTEEEEKSWGLFPSRPPCIPALSPVLRDFGDHDPFRRPAASSQAGFQSIPSLQGRLLVVIGGELSCLVVCTLRTKIRSLPEENRNQL